KSADWAVNAMFIFLIKLLFSFKVAIAFIGSDCPQKTSTLDIHCACVVLKSADRLVNAKFIFLIKPLFSFTE
ncbi:hypothetical protein, partial [Streptococcus thoraltensis]